MENSEKDMPSRDEKTKLQTTDVYSTTEFHLILQECKVQVRIVDIITHALP